MSKLIVSDAAAAVSVGCPTLEQLGEFLEVAWAAETALPDDVTDTKIDQVTAQTLPIVEQIVGIPARTLDQLRVKARAYLTFYGTLECPLDGIEHGPDAPLAEQALHSLLADLLDPDRVGAH